MSEPADIELLILGDFYVVGERVEESEPLREESPARVRLPCRESDDKSIDGERKP